jgi:glycosyltransferase involved in cell wall biosynthesis
MSARFSVAMCTYNGARFVSEQLASVAAQTRPPDELIVCDDCSTDGTREAIEEFAARAPFPVRLHVNERNLGSTRNFGHAVALCSGDLIALSDQDDVWNPEKLARLEARFAARPEVGFIFTDAELVDENLRSTGRRLWESVRFGPQEQRLVRRGRALDLLLPGWHVTGATMAFRAGFKKLVLEIPDDLALIHDGWIALMVSAVAEADFIEEPLIKYRQHSLQQIGAAEKPREEQGVAAATRRVNTYDELIRTAGRARERLSAWDDAAATRVALRRLDERLTHLRARAGLPAGKLRRVPYVLRELLTLRYHRYSKGVRSAAKDLLVKSGRQ